VPRSQGLAFEFDPQVFDLTKRKIAVLDEKIELIHSDYQSLLEDRRFPID
jgi:hypothetical protein